MDINPSEITKILKEQIKNQFRTRLLIRSRNNLFIQKDIAKILKKINLSKKIKLTVDVDPQNFS